MGVEYYKTVFQCMEGSGFDVFVGRACGDSFGVSQPGGTLALFEMDRLLFLLYSFYSYSTLLAVLFIWGARERDFQGRRAARLHLSSKFRSTRIPARQARREKVDHRPTPQPKMSSYPATLPPEAASYARQVSPTPCASPFGPADENASSSSTTRGEATSKRSPHPSPLASRQT